MLSNIITTDIIFIIVLTVALVAMALEVMIPSFGVIGVFGIYLLVESILALRNFQDPYSSIFISILLSAVITFILARVLLKNVKNNKLILQSNLSKAKGSRYAKVNIDLISKEGIVVKVLRPSGEIEIDDHIYTAISCGDFIGTGETVVVERIEGSQVLVKKVK